MQFFDTNEKLIFNLVCRSIYHKVIPGITAQVIIDNQPKYSLNHLFDWGKAADYDKEKVRGSKDLYTIDGEIGTYWGEWKLDSSG